MCSLLYSEYTVYSEYSQYNYIMHMHRCTCVVSTESAMATYIAHYIAHMVRRSVDTVYDLSTYMEYYTYIIVTQYSTVLMINF